MVTRPALTPDVMDSKLWLVFSDETDLKLLKILRRGFRHCFAVMQQDQRWIVIDPRSDKTDIQILNHPHHFNLPRALAAQGKTVLQIPAIQTPRRVANIMPWSCVEIMKRVIGLHKWWIITPYQLFRYLERTRN